jgi:methylglutamate dehydrogenase subunit B
MQIPCPHCGPRDSAEYAYYGDAARVRPALSDTDPDRWSDYVYQRDNRQGPHQEFWHHLHGCRQWLVVERNTLTHEILGVTMARDAAMAAARPAAPLARPV